MSTPKNPLDKFHTFSYHHFMIAANNSEILRQIEAKDVSFNSLTRLKHGELVSSGGGSSKVVMVLNSVVDSKFYIEAFNYTTIYNQNKDNGLRQTQASTMNIIIKETGGATFINFMREISDTILETSYSSVCFLLKTFFVGHTFDGKTETYHVDPIILHLTNMDSSFDHAGGTHTLGMVGMSNGAPLHNTSMLYVNRNLNLVTNDNSILLKDLIVDLEKKLNNQLSTQYETVIKATGGNGRKVKYKITIPEDWDHYTIKCTTKDNYIEKLFDKEKQAVQSTADTQVSSNQKEKPGVEADRFKSQVNTAVKTTIIQVLNEIFKHCDQIHEALVANAELSQATLNQTKDPKLARLHQVVASITSDSDLVTVHFDVINYYLPKLSVKPDDNLVSNQTKETTINNDQIAAQTLLEKKIKEKELGIIFEYIFTGKNSDIISFDIKANHTNIIFETNRPGITKAVRDAVTTASSDPKQVKNIDKNSDSIISMRKYDAVYLPELGAEAQHGYIYASPDSAKLRDDYVKTLARLTAITTSSSRLVIRGNPVFLNQTVRKIMPHNDAEYDAELKKINKDALESATKQYGEFDPTKSTTYMAGLSSHIPLFAKVVIKTPTIDPNTNAVTYEEFWYDGYYWITHIENKFINGDFTQELYIKPWDLAELDTNKT